MRHAHCGSDRGDGHARGQSGPPPVVEAALLPTLIGWGRARWMLMTGENIDASTGALWGLIDIWRTPANSTQRPPQRSLYRFRSALCDAQKRLMRDWERLSLRLDRRTSRLCRV